MCHHVKIAGRKSTSEITSLSFTLIITPLLHMGSFPPAGLVCARWSVTHILSSCVCFCERSSINGRRMQRTTIPLHHLNWVKLWHSMPPYIKPPCPLITKHQTLLWSRFWSAWLIFDFSEFGFWRNTLKNSWLSPPRNALKNTNQIFCTRLNEHKPWLLVKRAERAEIC